MDTFTESVHLSGSVAVQASAKHFRLHRAYLWEFAPFPESLPEAGDANVTRQTMAGAIYAGIPERSGDEEKANGLSPMLSHIYSLATAYHTTHATPPTMRLAARRLAERGQHAAAAHCLRVAEQETGHDALALKDIAALGLPAEKYVARLRPRAATAILELFTRLAESEEPIKVIGYVYVLERMAITTTANQIEALERLFPPGINATRCLREHSGAGGDTTHVAESIQCIAALPSRERAAIARGAYETSLVYMASSGDYPGDAAMRTLLQDFGGADQRLLQESRTSA